MSANHSMNLYISAKQNYKKLTTAGFQAGGEAEAESALLNRLLDNYVYQRGMNDNEGHREYVRDGMKYSTVYGEVVARNDNGSDNLKAFAKIANHFGSEFIGDLGSGRGMIPAGLIDRNDCKEVKHTYGAETLATRHDEAVKFMKNVLNADEKWSVWTSRLAEALGHAIIPTDLPDPSKYMNRVVFTHKTNGKILEYINADILYINYADLLKGYARPMFWISNLCFPEITVALFAKFRDTLPIGTIVILSRPPTDIEQYGFIKMDYPELGINKGRLELCQTWNKNDYVECLEFRGKGSTGTNQSIL